MTTILNKIENYQKEADNYLNNSWQSMQQWERDIEQIKEEAYIDYFNNYLSVEAFATGYLINRDEAIKLIEEGRNINHNRNN